MTTLASSLRKNLSEKYSLRSLSFTHALTSKDNPTGIIGKRFHGFRYVPDLWKWYDECLVEFHRILKPGGFLIFKCQDTVSSGKQWLSHVHIINEAEKLGLYTKDFFVLNAKNRIKGHNHQVQKHARKFHSYFIVFEKPKLKKSKIENNV
jgi:DNA modification methylase